MLINMYNETTLITYMVLYGDKNTGIVMMLHVHGINNKNFFVSECEKYNCSKIITYANWILCPNRSSFLFDGFVRVLG